MKPGIGIYLTIAGVLVAVFVGPTILPYVSKMSLTQWSDIATIAQGIVAVILLLYAFVFARELRESIRTRHLEGLTMVRELMSTRKAAEDRKWVYQELKRAARPLSDDDAERIREICRPLDYIGLLCRHGLLPVDTVIETYHRNIVDMWNHVQPLVVQWRQGQSGEDYYAEFEWLAVRASDWQRRPLTKVRTWWRRHLRHSRRYPLYA